VAGLVMPDAGQAQVDEIDALAEPARAQARLGMLADARGLYGRLTARENISYFGRLHGMEARAADARADTLARLLGLTPLLDRRCEGFSLGERMKTALARALVHDPPNIVLDEPTHGLDVMAVRALREVLRRLRDESGKCIIFCSHVMQEVERLCDEVVIVAAGRTVAHGTVGGLLASSGHDSLESGFVTLAAEADAAARAQGEREGDGP
jgi:sodium transport system ATP-binding protein